jgi:LPS-assembly lipoprotein
LLAGCGFQLRRAPDFAFRTITINAPASSPLAEELRRALVAGGDVTVVTSASAPAATPAAPASGVPAAPLDAVILDLPLEQREKVVVGLNATGQVREFQLRTRVRFRVRTARGTELIPETELLQQRDMSFSEAVVLAKEQEEALLYRDMQAELVQQLMRRLGALKLA